MLSGILIRFRSLFRLRQVEQELDEELGFNLDQQTEKYMRTEMNHEEALLRAWIQFAGLDQAKEHCRETRA